ncbi:MAG: hypothetical protein O3B41_07875 [Bacteroidetes bacterium]|nr:hypothetical protein [Bacteroidota bacterium]
MNEEVRALIEGEVDGVNSPSERIRLIEICASDPAVQLELDKSIEVAHLLQHIVAKEPSANFHHKVMTSLPQRPSWAPRTVSSPSWLSLFKLPPKPSFVLAYGFAAGSVIMFALIFSFADPSYSGETSGISGTMAPSSSTIFSENVVGVDGEDITVTGQLVQDQVIVSISPVLNAESTIAIKIENKGSVVFEKAFQPK